MPVRERTNSDNFANTLTFQVNEIEQELSKPSDQKITSFTENMVYTHPPRCVKCNGGFNQIELSNEKSLLEESY